MILKIFLTVLMILLTTAVGPAAENEIDDLSKKDLTLKQARDMQAVKIYRHGLADMIEYLYSRRDLFPNEKLKHPHMLKQQARNEVVAIWKSLLDYYIALDSVAAFHRDFLKIDDKPRQELSFHIFRAAFLAEYRFALDFIAAAENNPSLDTLFNESENEIGLTGNIYANFKYRFLNIRIASEFAAFEAVAASFRKPKDIDLNQYIEEDRKKIWSYGKDKGPALAVKNGMKILQKAGNRAWFPVQKGVSMWMGQTKVYRKHDYLIKEKQIQKFTPLLEPGDILLERREWYLTNVGIPGYWSHVALYIGTAEERKSYFNDPQTRMWLQKQGSRSFEQLLFHTYPRAYTISSAPADDENPVRVMEAIAAGVVFSSLEFSAACDSLAILRPRLEKRDKAFAIFRAFQYHGRPYDYNFDYLTDNSLVCTELLFKAFEPGVEAPGLKLPLEKIGKHLVTPVNAFARQFSQTYNTDRQQMDLVLFMDGYEKSHSAVRSDVSTFLTTWKRPKWHIIQQTLQSRKP
jgi:hypothetical protein